MMENTRKQVLFIGNDFILPFRPFELNYKYSVLYTIQKATTIQTLEQHYSLRRLQSDIKQEDYHFIQIDKISELLIDGKPIDEKKYELADKTGQFLFPLRIVVNKCGKWVDLNSYNKLKERWKNQQEEIKEYYEGLLYDNICESIENDIIDDKSLVGFISGNWFLRAFFNGLHDDYTRKFEIQKKLFFPVVAEIEDIEFLITQKVDPYLNELNQIVVSQNGEPECEYINAIYSAEYLLNPHTYIIDHLELECDLIDMDQRIKIEIKNLDKSIIVGDSEISLLVKN